MDFVPRERRASFEEQATHPESKRKGFAVTAVETPETHDGTAWHYSLIHFVELLFSEH